MMVNDDSEEKKESFSYNFASEKKGKKKNEENFSLFFGAKIFVS